ncbi:hypothetical protein IPC1107_31695 [Pseudomonas aeruginosa]|nr:hypothetical protein IPC1107_31695 [Pseudomonas aeruginosa]
MRFAVKNVVQLGRVPCEHLTVRLVKQQAVGHAHQIHSMDWQCVSAQHFAPLNMRISQEMSPLREGKQSSICRIMRTSHR